MWCLLASGELARYLRPGPDEVDRRHGGGDRRRPAHELLGDAGPGNRADEALEDRRDLLVADPPVIAEPERRQGERQLDERRELADEPGLDVGGLGQFGLDRGPIGRPALDELLELGRSLGRRFEGRDLYFRCVHRRIPRPRAKGAVSGAPRGAGGFVCGSGAGGWLSGATFGRGRNRWVTGSRSSVDARARARSERIVLLTFVRFVAI
jgi:hypothetical protein